VEHISYQELVNQATHLSRPDQERLLEELRSLVQHPPRGPEARSILELQGLGKAIWAAVDAQEYVNKERASWDG
jgi:hypothetical protein